MITQLPMAPAIRDYVHVEDLVEAHVVVMQALRPGDERIYNLGIGQGCSVKEMLDAARRVIDRPFEGRWVPDGRVIPRNFTPTLRRSENELGWRASRTDIGKTIESVWRWFRDHPQRYSD